MLNAIGGSSSGRTTGSGPVSEGSSPSPPARKSEKRKVKREFYPFILFLYNLNVVLSSRGPGHRPLTAETRVRIPLGLPIEFKACRSSAGFLLCGSKLVYLD
jgi:hypothetical protein